MDSAASVKSIERSCNGLLLKGAQLLDENKVPNEEPVKKPEKKKKKGELIAETLEKLLKESMDVQGAAIVGNDGLVYSANVPDKDLDENIVGAASAAIIGLSRRSASQLRRGNFTQTLIQGDNGNIIVTGLSDQTLFVGLTPKDVNLGMAFAEVRDFASKLSGIV
jgi:predicted regulator of Ras-like GTPase activity (Roadblock/LC7/MglB family)